MRLILIAAAALTFAGAAQAQIDPYGRPKPLNPLPPLGSTQSMPSMPSPAPFKPYKPPTAFQPILPSTAADPYPHARHTPGLIPTPPAATPADPYPSLHPRRKHEPF